MMFGRNLRGKPQAITRPANILSCVVTPDLEIRRHDLAFAIGPRVIKVQADERVTRLDAVHAASFQAPVLIFHGDTDLNVGVGQSRLMNERLRTAGKQVTYVEFPTLDHQLDTTAARTRLLTDSDRFLRTALGL